MRLFGPPNIAKLAERRDVRGLADALADRDAKVRRDALQALTDLGLKVVGAERTWVATALRWALNYSDDAARAAARAALASLGRGPDDEDDAFHEDLEAWELKGQLARDRGDTADLADCMRAIAEGLEDHGDLAASLLRLDDAERAYRSCNNMASLGFCLEHRARILKAQGNAVAAEAARGAVRSLVAETHDPALLPYLNRQAHERMEAGDPRGALEALVALEKAWRQASNRLALAACLALQGRARCAYGDIDTAKAAFTESLAIYRELGEPAGVTACLAGLARIAHDRGALAEALALYAEQEPLERSLQNRDNLALCLARQALIRQAQGEIGKSATLRAEAYALFPTASDRAALIQFVLEEAESHRDRGHLAEALALYTEMERLCREQGDRAGLAMALTRRADMHGARAEFATALPLYHEAELIFREVNAKEQQVLYCLSKQAIIRWDERDDVAGALELYREYERICRAFDDQAGVASALEHQARALAALGRAADGVPLAEQAVALAVGLLDTKIIEVYQETLRRVRARAAGAAGPAETRSAPSPEGVASAPAPAAAAIAPGVHDRPGSLPTAADSPEPAPPGAAARLVRVFISSTFRDMQAERDELVKRIFPELRNRCRQRGVDFVEVDLRWGVTEKQAERGEVLPICLAEIDRCRPYFVALLGERYGWVPSTLDAELRGERPWLARLSGHSVTELEILHGVLRDPARARRSFFYFRNPDYAHGRPPADQPNFLPESPESADRLAALKNQIEEAKLPLVKDYPDPQWVGQRILDDLWAAIDAEYPEGSQPDPLDREAAEHEGFAARRAATYIARQAYFDRLDAFVAGDEPGLVLTGPSGGGKSALLANWARQYAECHPADFLLMHFTGSTPRSADWVALLQRLLGELRRHFGIEEELPTQEDALRAVLPRWLATAAGKGRVVLVLDALNQLEDRDGAPDLAWLPDPLPAGVRLLASALPGRALDQLARRGWPQVEVALLEPAERRQLVVDYLARFSKALSPERAAGLAAAPQAANPLFLRTLLDELRIFGVHEQLDERIAHYLGAAGVPELYDLILARYEADYERDRPGLVGEALGLIWTARRGLSESELLELLGQNDQPLPRAAWSPLYLAAEESLVSRTGLLSFAHDYLRQAVQQRYLPDTGRQSTCHLRLADYFAARAGDERRLDEVPWQLARAGAWWRLYDLLADVSTFDELWGTSPHEAQGYWAQIERQTSWRIVTAYAPALEAPERYRSHLRSLARFLAATRHPREALRLQEYLVMQARQRGDPKALLSELEVQSNFLADEGEAEQALALYREQERLARELNDRVSEAMSLLNQAAVLINRHADGGPALLDRAEQMARELGREDILVTCLQNRAAVLSGLDDLAGALDALRSQERLERKRDDHAALARCLINQARILGRMFDPTNGMTTLAEAERLARELGDAAMLRDVLTSQTLLSDMQRSLEIVRSAAHEPVVAAPGAPAVTSEALAAASAHEPLAAAPEPHAQPRPERSPEWLQAASFMRRAIAARDNGDDDGALALLAEVERCWREVGDRTLLRETLMMQVQLLIPRGGAEARWEKREDGTFVVSEVSQGAVEALKPLAEANGLARELEKQPELADGLRRQVLLLIGICRPGEALPIYREAVALHRALGDVSPMLDCLDAASGIIDLHADAGETLALYREAEALYRAEGDQGRLAACLARCAERIQTMGDRPAAQAVLAEEASLRGERGDHAGLATCLAHQAMLQLGVDDGQAAALFGQAAGEYQLAGDTRGRAGALVNQSVALARSGQHGEALAAANEACDLSPFNVETRKVALGTAAQVAARARDLRHRASAGALLCAAFCDFRLDVRQAAEAALRSIGWLPPQAQAVPGGPGVAAPATMQEVMSYETLCAVLAANLVRITERSFEEGAVAEAQALAFEGEQLVRPLLALEAHDPGDPRVLKALETLGQDRQIHRKILAALLDLQARAARTCSDGQRALALYGEESPLWEQAGERGMQASCLRQQASLQAELGDWAGHRQSLSAAEQLWRALGEQDELAQCLTAQAFAALQLGDLDDAESRAHEAEGLARSLNKVELLWKALCYQSNVCARRGDLDGALAHSEQQAAVCRQHNVLDGMANALSAAAGLLGQRGDLDAAWAHLTELEPILRELDDQAGLKRCLSLRDQIAEQRTALNDRFKSLLSEAQTALGAGDHRGALQLLEQISAILQELGKKSVLKKILGARIDILGITLHEHASALALMREQEGLIRELNDRPGLALCLANQVIMLRALDDRPGLLRAFDARAALYRELGDTQKLVSVLSELCNALRANRESDRALAVARERETFAAELDDQAALPDALNDLGVVLFERNEMAAACEVWQRQETLCRARDHRPGLILALSNQALALAALGQEERALACRRAESDLCRSEGNKRALLASLAWQAGQLRKKDQAGALAAWLEAEPLCHELGDKDTLIACLYDIGLLLRARGQREEALVKMKLMEAVCREKGTTDGLARCLGAQASILGEMGRPLEGLPLIEEASQIASGAGLTQLVAAIDRIAGRLRGAAGTPTATSA